MSTSSFPKRSIRLAGETYQDADDRAGLLQRGALHLSQYKDNMKYTVYLKETPLRGAREPVSI